MKKIKHVLTPDSPCPCNSGKRLAACCLVGGRLYKAPPIVMPKGRPTGLRRDGCYLSETGNCSNSLSGEHYISRNVLEAIGPTIRMHGVSWLPPGESKVVGLNALTANILCERHNSALSPLDAVAGQFFRQLKAIDANTQRKSLSRRSTTILFSGEALEMWMLKVACGIFFAKTVAPRTDMPIVSHALNTSYIVEAFQGRWGPLCGLYVSATPGLKFASTIPLQVSPLASHVDHRIVGVSLKLLGLEYSTIFDSKEIDAEELKKEGMVYRPSELLFREKLRSHCISLAWPQGTPEKSIQITMPSGRHSHRRL